MSGVRVKVDSEKARQTVLRVAEAMKPDRIDPLIDRAAWETHARLVRKTPKRWFGQVRRGWTVIKPRTAVRVVTNQNPIMLFLEAGTKDHGPREIYGPLQPGQPRKKKAMFIPLTRRAANATQGIYGVGTTIQVVKHTQSAATLQRVRAIYQRTEHVRKGKRVVGNRALIFGKDYVLAKRVKGIKAMNIVENERPRARKRLSELMKEHLREAIKGGK